MWPQVASLLSPLHTAANISRKIEDPCGRHCTLHHYAGHSDYQTQSVHLRYCSFELFVLMPKQPSLNSQQKPHWKYSFWNSKSYLWDKRPFDSCRLSSSHTSFSHKNAVDLQSATANHKQLSPKHRSLTAHTHIQQSSVALRCTFITEPTTAQYFNACDTSQLFYFQLNPPYGVYK